MSDGGNVIPRITKAEHIGPDDTGDNIEAKRIANYGYNSASSSWVRFKANSDGSLASGSANLAVRTDSISTAFVTYVGKAPIGTATSSAGWQIFKVDESTTGVVIITWADGNDNFDNIYDNRASLSYS